MQTDKSMKDLKPLAHCIRALAMDAVEQAKSGHPGMPMGMADVATVLFTRHLKFDPKAPDWPDRDRFVLSAGHGSMLLYALLHLCGYPDATLDELKNFRQLGSKTAGHPEYGHLGGVETTTGPLGQGFANAVGMALAERHLNAAFGDDLVDHLTYVIAGDGCLMEGISHEAASLAGHLKLGRLIVLYDDNNISIDGSTDLSFSEDSLSRFQAYGWQTIQIDGHDTDAIDQAIRQAQKDPRPSLIACKTLIGYGAPKLQGTAKAHGAPLGADEIAGVRQQLGWDHPPFVIPDSLRQSWLEYGKRGDKTRLDWEKQLSAHPEKTRFLARLKGDGPQGWEESARAYCDAAANEGLKMASRAASQHALDHFIPAREELVGGSADLTGSNNTKITDMTVLTAQNYGGRYIHYGVREHAMAAAMNGMALHGGLIPYGGTFLVFSDYARPAMRLAALMGIQVIYVMTHDSIGLGEDGPTHQPVEHLAALRAIPDLLVLRPADVVETIECWHLALQEKKRPSVLALSRQGLPPVRGPASAKDKAQNLCARGGYILQEAKGERALTLIATGSEVGLAVQAASQLSEQGHPTAVVSLPSFQHFREQSSDYQAHVLGSAPRLAIEAGVRQGWDEWLRATDSYRDHFIGMSGFGASGPGPELYQHFGFGVEAIVEKALSLL